MANESPYDRLGTSLGDNDAREQRVPLWGGESLFFLAAVNLGEWRQWRRILIANPTIDDPADPLSFEVVSPTNVLVALENLGDGVADTITEDVSEDSGRALQVDASSPGPDNGWSLVVDDDTDAVGPYYTMTLRVGDIEGDPVVIRDEDFYESDGTATEVSRFLQAGRFYIRITFDADTFLQLLLLGTSKLDPSYEQGLTEVLIPSFDLPQIRGAG